MYCSASFKLAALALPSDAIASETNLIPRAVASDLARNASAAPLV